MVAYVLFTVILAVTIAEEIGEDVAESWELRSPRCEHHNHDGKRPTKWLGKLKRTKTQYASSKPHSRPKSHYGQPYTHNRPPKPQYIPPAANFRIPPYNPPASYLAPHYSQSAVQNPNSLQQVSYSPQHNSQASHPPNKNPNSNPQSLSYDPLAHVSPASTKAPPYAPPSYSNAPYPQSPEDFEDLSLPMSVYIPPAQVHNPSGPYSPAQAPVAVSYDPPATTHTEAANYFAPTNSPSAYTETTSPPSYTEAPSPHVYNPAPPAYDPQIASETEAPYLPSSSQVPVYDPPTTYAPQVSTEHSVYSHPSNAQYDEAYSPPVPTRSTPEPYNPPAVTENTPEPYVPLQQHQNTPVPYALPHPPSLDSALYYPPASTEAPDYFPPSYGDASYSQSYNPTEKNKNTHISYSFPHPSDSAPYYPAASTEAPDYFHPSYSDSPSSEFYNSPEQNKNTQISYTFPHPPSPDSASYYPPVSTKAPDYFLPSYDESPYLESYNPPASMYNAPTSYSPPSFPNSNFPSFSFPSFMESVDRSTLGYKDVRYPSTNDRASAYNPSHKNEEFFQSGSFPRFNEFLQQMLRGKM